MCFRRLDDYTYVPPTNEMMDLNVQIMAQVLSVLEVATEQLKPNQLGEYFPYKCDISD
jgi:hypothetical protein